MSENNEQTSLKQVADGIAAALFDGVSTANDIITPIAPSEIVIVANEETPDGKVFDVEKSGILNPKDSTSTSELIGDILNESRKKSKKQEDSVEIAEIEESDEDEGEKTTKFSFLSDLYKEKVLEPFEDDAPINSVKDLKELIKANNIQSKQLGKEEGQAELLSELPEPVQILVEYARSGGDDFQTIFNLLARAQSAGTRTLDNEEGQTNVVREYYRRLNWEEDDIESQVNILKDAGPERLKSTSAKFEAKLSELDNAALEEQLEAQKELEAQSKVMQKNYIDNLTTTLKKGTLGGIKLTRDDQRDLYAALIEERYPTFNGGHTNRLGAKLHEIQFQKPDFELLAEVTMLLNDREGYHKRIKDSITTEVTTEQVRKIKTEQGIKGTGSDIQQPKRPGLRRVDGISNPFK